MGASGYTCDGGMVCRISPWPIPENRGHAMGNFAPGTFRACKYGAVIVSALVATGMVSGCQSLDTTETNSLLKPAGYFPGDADRLTPAVFAVRSPRIDQPIEMATITSVTTTAGVHPFVSRQPVKTPTAAPVNAAFNVSDDGPLMGNSPYVCSPSGFGQLANCHARLY